MREGEFGEVKEGGEGGGQLGEMRRVRYDCSVVISSRYRQAFSHSLKELSCFQ